MNEATKAEVMAAMAKWRPRLRLMDWAITFQWNAADVTVARCFTEQRYRRAKLAFSPSFPSLDGDDVPGAWLTLEKMVLHELCHIVVTHLHITGRAVIGVAKVAKAVEEQAFDRLDDANEFTTEWLARLLWEAWEHTAWDAEPPS